MQTLLALETLPQAAPLAEAPTQATAAAMRPAAPLAPASADAAPGQPAVLALYAQVLGAHSLAAAAHRLVTGLALDLAFSRVSFGLREQGRSRLLASSTGEFGDRQGELLQRLTGAMDEALDQALPLAWPAAEAAPAGVAVNITIEQSALQALCGGVVASVPVGQGSEVFGALCVQRDV